MPRMLRPPLGAIRWRHSSRPGIIRFAPSAPTTWRPSEAKRRSAGLLSCSVKRNITACATSISENRARENYERTQFFFPFNALSRFLKVPAAARDRLLPAGEQPVPGGAIQSRLEAPVRPPEVLDLGRVLPES